jgi:hypothetical protein
MLLFCWEEHRLTVFEKRGMFGYNGDELKGGGRKTHNADLLNLCYSSSTIKMIKLMRMRLVKHVVSIGEVRN